MSHIGIDHCLRRFDEGIGVYLNLTLESRQYLMKTGGKLKSIGPRRMELIAGASLLAIYKAWEDFVESTFIRYICGGITASGYAPVLMNPRFRTTNSAFTTLLGNANYINWNPGSITTRADLYFDTGEPYSMAIMSIRQTLDEIVVVRNRYAHRSQYTYQEFQSVVRRYLGYMPQGITPGRFLLTINPSYGDSNIMFIEHYANSLLTAARTIIP